MSNKIIAAGLLMYKIQNEKLFYFLCKAGGPYYKNKRRVWSIPKGHTNKNETLLETAIREFKEETGIPIINDLFKKLPIITNKDKKEVHIYAFRQSYDIENKPITSNTISLEWPIGSGIMIEVPEMIEGNYFTYNNAKDIIFSYQLPLLEHMEKLFLDNKLFLY